MLPNIPAQVIGYGLAGDIFNMIDGYENVPSKWKGEMNVTYTFGGKLKDRRYFRLGIINIFIFCLYLFCFFLVN